ncbi:MAG: polymorphic toxin type 44 domain-containing protein [Butyrivibrio hungatei]|nr:polymorphic toxin type 44 domain-containing protein [Butyrivibrio hungatei]
MAKEDKVFMDTGVFTDIVEDIRGAASECVFPDNALRQANRIGTFNAGRKMQEILKEIHKTDEMYRRETSESLPTAFLKMRDSMIAIDDACANSLTVEKISANNLSAASASIPIGQRYAQKQLQKGLEKGKEKAKKNYDNEYDYNRSKNTGKTLTELQALNIPDANLPDHTEMIDKWLADQEKYFDKLNPGDPNPITGAPIAGKAVLTVAFYNKVKTGGDMDIKQKRKWEDAFGIPYPEGDNSYFIYHGQVMDAATLGNVTYSYIGAKYYSDFALYSGGAAVQTKRRDPSDLPYMYTLPDYGDMPEDHESIGLGIKWRKEGFPNGN